MPLASGVGVGASCWWSGEWQGVGDWVSGREGKFIRQGPIIQNFVVALAIAARDAGSVIKESLLHEHGECRAKVLTDEEADRLRSSYMIIAEAFRIASSSERLVRSGPRRRDSAGICVVRLRF